MGNFKSLRRFCGVLIVGLLLVGPAWSKVYLPEDTVKLDVQVKGTRVHFTIRNVSPYDIQVFNDFRIYGAPNDWPFFSLIQIRDSSGRIITVDSEGRPTTWTPWFLSSQAVSPPDKLDWLRAGTIREIDADLFGCLKHYAYLSLRSSNPRRHSSNSRDRDKEEQRLLKSFDSVKIFFFAKLNRRLSESIRLETEWINLTTAGGSPKEVFRPSSAYDLHPSTRRPSFRVHNAYKNRLVRPSNPTRNPTTQPTRGRFFA